MQHIDPWMEGKCARKRQSEDVMYNSYYQWVSLCLVGQVSQPANRNLSVNNPETVQRENRSHCPG